MVLEVSLILISVVGGLVALAIYSCTAGVLTIDSSNPEKDVYRFDVYDLDKLSKKKYVLLKVKRSQK